MNLLLFYGLLSMKMLINPDLSQYNVKFCFNVNCKSESFNGSFNENCGEHTEFQTFRVISILEDRKFYQIILNNSSFWINVECVENVTEILPFTFPVQLESFNESEITNIQHSLFSANKSSSEIGEFNTSTNDPELIPSLSQDIPPEAPNNNETHSSSINESTETKISSILPEIFNVHSENSNIDNPVNTIKGLADENPQSSARLLSTSLIKEQAHDYHFMNIVLVKAKSYFDYLLKPIDYEIFHSNLHVVVTVFLTLILIHRIYKSLFSHHYQIHESKLRKFYQQNIDILQENKLKSQQLYLDTSTKLQNTEKLYDDHIKDCQSRTTLSQEQVKISGDLKAEKLALQEEIEKYKSAELESKQIVIRYNEILDKFNSLSTKATQLESELILKDSSIKAVELKLNELKILYDNQTKIVHTFETDQQQLEQKNSAALKQINTIYSLFSGLSTKYNNSKDHSSVSEILTQVTEQDYVEYFNQINNKLSRLKELENTQQEFVNLELQNKLLTDNITNIQQANAKFEVDFAKYKDDNYRLETEIKIMKKHFNETEWNLHEKYNLERHKAEELQKKLDSISDDTKFIPDLKNTIVELKRQIAITEQSSKKQVEERAIESNNHYISAKKMERELDRVNNEKEDYRLKLLNVLEENQKIQNQRTEFDNQRKPIISSHTTKEIPSISRRSESPVRSSYYKNAVGSPSFLPPPPPPPPMPFSPEMYKNYFPRHSSPIFDPNDNNPFPMLGLIPTDSRNLNNFFQKEPQPPNSPSNINNFDSV